MLLTVGVYGSTGAAFFAALEEAGVDVLVDIRLRRAVRGAQYAYANAQNLIAALEERGIAYLHARELAPDRAMLELQSAADERANLRKSQRTELSAAYVKAYTKKLGTVDLAELARELAPFRTPALLCIERTPAACHRSIVAPKLAAVLKTQVRHLEPGGAGFQAARAVAARNRKRAALRKKYG